MLLFSNSVYKIVSSPADFIKKLFFLMRPIILLKQNQGLTLLSLFLNLYEICCGEVTKYMLQDKFRVVLGKFLAFQCVCI